MLNIILFFWYIILIYYFDISIKYNIDLHNKKYFMIFCLRSFFQYIYRFCIITIMLIVNSYHFPVSTVDQPRSFLISNTAAWYSLVSCNHIRNLYYYLTKINPSLRQPIKYNMALYVSNFLGTSRIKNNVNRVRL